MRDNIKLFGTVFVALLVILVVSISLIGFAGAQETGGGSATIDYDYDAEEINYELNQSLFDPYRLQAISEAERYESTQIDDTGAQTHIQWADGGTRLYTTSGGGDLYQYEASEPYNATTLSYVNNQHIPGLLDGYIVDFRLGNNGQELIYVLSESQNTLRQASLGTAYDPTSMGFNNDHSISFRSFYSAHTLGITNNGQTIYAEDSSGFISETQLSTAWDISSNDGFSITRDDIYPNRDMEDMHFVDDNDQSFLATWGGTNEIEKLSTSDGWNSYSRDYTKALDSIDSFTMSESGRDLFVKPEIRTRFIVDSYDTNEYQGIITGENGNTIVSLDSVNQTGQVSFAPSTVESDIQLNWSAVTDSSVSGSSNTIDIYPTDEMSIRDEQTNELITESVNVTAYGDESGIYSLNTADGTIDITSLPNQAYTFAVQASGYYQRVRYVEQLGNAENLYLLDNSTDTVTSQFQLEDRTNTYEQDSRLVIRRSIPGDGNEWQTIISDTFGSEGLTLDLEEDVRYRLYVETDNQMQLIGPYRASISETVTVSPTSGEIGVSDEAYWSAGASYGSQDVNVRFIDPVSDTDSVSITIYERGNESNILIDEDMYINPSELQLEYLVPDEYNESNWIVELTVTRESETYTTSFNVGPTANIVPTELDDFWRKIFAVMLMLTFGMIFSIRNKAVGSIVYACVGGLFYWIGLLEGLTTAGLVVGYFFIVIIYNIYMKS